MYSSKSRLAFDSSQSVLYSVQASEMAGVCDVLQTVEDPLCLSLALDVMEEVLGSRDCRRYGRLMAREGALAALVHALPLPQVCCIVPGHDEVASFYGSLSFLQV